MKISWRSLRSDLKFYVDKMNSPVWCWSWNLTCSISRQWQSTLVCFFLRESQFIMLVFILGPPVCTYVLPWNPCLYFGLLRGLVRGVCVCLHSSSEDASNASLFRVATGISAVSTTQPSHTTTHTHRVWPSTSLRVPLALVAADGHSREGLVSLADCDLRKRARMSACVCVSCTFVKAPLLNHARTPPLSTHPLPSHLSPPRSLVSQRSSGPDHLPALFFFSFAFENLQACESSSFSAPTVSAFMWWWA